MKRTPVQFRRAQRATAFLGLMMFNLVLVVIQLWMFVGVLESLLDGRTTMAIPAAIGSFVILGINSWMLVGIYRMERLG